MVGTAGRNARVFLDPEGMYPSSSGIRWYNASDSSAGDQPIRHDLRDIPDDQALGAHGSAGIVQRENADPPKVEPTAP